MTDESTETDMITRAEALERAADHGVPFNERTLDRYRDNELLTTHRRPEKPFLIELESSQVDSLIEALKVVDAEGTPETKRIGRIREVMAGLGDETEEQRAVRHGRQQAQLP